MKRPRVRFTIRSLMIAVVVVAALLTLAKRLLGVIALVLSLPFLALIGASWLVFRGHRRLASFCFWVPAILANSLYAALCIAPEFYALLPFSFGLIIFFPTITALGIAWAFLSSRERAVPRHSALAAGFLVFVLAVLPLVTVTTFWPLHMAFLTARPTLELLADQVAAGQAVGFPRWAGPFRVVGSAVDPISGNVGLMINANPNGPTGFVRIRPSTPPNYSGPIVGSDLDVGLGGRWWYRQED